MPGNFQVTEVQGQLRQSGQVKLDANGNGTIYFTPTSSHQRWEVNQVVVQTNQPSTATLVPVATLALNANDLTTMSQGNYQGATWSGNQDSWSGQLDVGPCDFLALILSPPPGQSGASLSGVIANAVVTGTRYTRMA